MLPATAEVLLQLPCMSFAIELPVYSKIIQIKTNILSNWKDEPIPIKHPYVFDCSQCVSFHILTPRPLSPLCSKQNNKSRESSKLRCLNHNCAPHNTLLGAGDSE